MKLTTQAALALALPAAVQAANCRPSPTPGSDDCHGVDDVNHVLHDYPSASAFCSTFLSIPTVTKTAAVTVTQATTISDVLTSTVTPVVTATATEPVISSFCSADVTPMKQKRDAQHTTPTAPAPSGPVQPKPAPPKPEPPKPEPPKPEPPKPEPPKPEPPKPEPPKPEPPKPAPPRPAPSNPAPPKPAPPKPAPSGPDQPKPAPTKPTPTKPPSPTGGLPDCLHPFPTSRISKACSCLQLPTPTVTVTQTETLLPTSMVTAEVTVTADPSTTTETMSVTVTVPGCPMPTTCNNAGLEWALLDNLSEDDDAPGYPEFDPSNYKNVPPFASGVTYSIGWDSNVGPDISIYGSGVPSIQQNIVVDHRGYIYAPTTGNYAVEFLDVDDVVYFWIGDAAYSGWLAANADAKVAYPQTQWMPNYLEAGNYYPIRIVFAQNVGASVLSMRISAPDGTVILGDDTIASSYIVRYSCDELSAPPYPAWQNQS